MGNRKRINHSLNEVLQPSIDEVGLRLDKNNNRLRNPHFDLVDVSETSGNIRMVTDEEGLSARYVMPLTDVSRRTGHPEYGCQFRRVQELVDLFWGSLSQILD